VRLGASVHGHIDERAVVLIVIEAAGGRAYRRGNFHGRAVQKNNIGLAIVVVIENRCAIAGGLDDEFFMLIAAIDIESGQSALARDVFKLDNPRFGGWRGICLRMRRLSEGQSCYRDPSHENAEKLKS
jgi:hypothetical protein